MTADVDTKDIEAVFREAGRIHFALFADADPGFMPRACEWFRSIFDGEYADYQPIDVPYHDREHTMQGLLCLVRLLAGRHRSGAEPAVTRRMFELGVMAILLHDTGYLRHRPDTEGSGAKYTLIHVERSRDFASRFLSEQGYTVADISAVRNMIQCTALAVPPRDIEFNDDIERIVGYSVATADLMGQMSADDYVDRLPQLYHEFRESYEYYGDEARHLNYESPDSLLANTPKFWRTYVMPKLDHQCEGVYKYLNDPYPDGDNPYLDRILANVDEAARRAGSVASAR